MMLRIALFVCAVIMVNSQVPPVIPVGSITEGPKTTAPPSVKGTEYKMFERKLVSIFLPITFQMCFFFYFIYVLTLYGKYTKHHRI